MKALGRQAEWKKARMAGASAGAAARTCSVEPSRRTTSHPVSGTAEVAMHRAGATSLPAADGADAVREPGDWELIRLVRVVPWSPGQLRREPRGPGSPRIGGRPARVDARARPSCRAAGRAARRARPPSRPRRRRPGPGFGWLAPRAWRRATARRMALRPARPSRRLPHGPRDRAWTASTMAGRPVASTAAARSLIAA